ncbi:MAG: CHAT domain-containing protein, partial [bacterium]|nr:CHAT domain-containing protein [bacterium]
MPEKPIIYNVTIEKSEKENSHRITWHNPKTDTKEYFDSEAEITAEEAKTLWQKRKHQHPVGAKLFRFLDGNNRYFQDCLHHAYLQGEPIHMHLHTNRETADWPFELLAYEDKFLLPYRLHLDRSITQFGAGKKISPKKRPLKLLFMACSAMDVKSVLNYEREEEAIYQITRNLSIDMEVDDTGSLEGLYNRLEQEEYDVVHLSGHADINKKKRPFFVMEDETGKHQRVYPEDLWNKALIENHPRLLFLSGCHTGHTPDSPENPAAVSFSRLLVEEYDVPAVLGWGRSVGDKQAIHAQNLLYHELCRGKSILHAVRRARLQMLTYFPMSSTPAWPLLRLFSSGIPLNAIVQKGLRRRPKARRTRYLYLKRSRVKVLTKGFIGRRRQIQAALRALKPGSDKNGIIILGTAGLGKSCLAARISQRFAGVTMIIIQGKLEKNTLQRALKDAFIAAQDKEGEKILARKTTMIKKLDDLC